MRDVAYAAPGTLDEALALLARGSAVALAGGQRLVPDLRMGRRQAELLVDLRHLPELGAALPRDEFDGGPWLGALVTVDALARDGALLRDHAALVEAAASVGDQAVRNRSTLGGA